MLDYLIGEQKNKNMINEGFFGSIAPKIREKKERQGEVLGKKENKLIIDFIDRLRFNKDEELTLTLLYNSPNGLVIDQHMSREYLVSRKMLQLKMYCTDRDLVIEIDDISATTREEINNYIGVSNDQLLAKICNLLIDRLEDGMYLVYSYDSNFWRRLFFFL